MHSLALHIGPHHAEWHIPADRWVPAAPPFAGKVPLEPVADHVRQVIEQPIDFPAFRKALTPDDLVVIVVPPRLNQLAAILEPLVDHIHSAQVPHEKIVLLEPPLDEGNPRSWRTTLPASLMACPMVTHDPKNRSKLAFLSSTDAGKPIYLNRLLLDAGQVFVIGQIGYDPIFGFRGGFDQIYPIFSHEQAWQDHQKKLSPSQIGHIHNQAAREAEEVGKYLGFPLFLQVFEGAGDAIWAVRAGLCDNLHDDSCQQWREAAHVDVQRPADLVIATLTQQAEQQSYHEIAAAFFNAARAVKTEGKIVVLSQAHGAMTPGLSYLDQQAQTIQGLAQARQDRVRDLVPLWQIASASEQGHLFLFSQYPAVEGQEGIVTPLTSLNQVQRLIEQADSVLYLPEAQRSLVTMKGNA